jgi:hypothetical protein
MVEPIHLEDGNKAKEKKNYINTKKKGKRNKGGIAGREDAVRKAAPLEVIGDLVLEPGGGVELPLGELLLQPIASDLAQRLHRRKGIDRIVSRIETENPPRGRCPRRRIRWIRGRRDRYLSGRRGGARHGGDWVIGLGEGNRILEEDGRRRRRRRPREGEGEKPQRSPDSPFLFRFQTWMLPVFFFSLLSCFFFPIERRTT